MITNAHSKIPSCYEKIPLARRNPLKVGCGNCAPSAVTNGHGGGCCHLLAAGVACCLDSAGGCVAGVACCLDSASGRAHALVVGAWRSAAVLASCGLAHALVVGAWCSAEVLAPSLRTGLCDVDVNAGCVQDLRRPGTSGATLDAGRWLRCANQLCTIRLPRASG